ncbi:MAG TPA: GNAT family N-acetyltransferase [Candidatus Binatia bacterium]|jgi:RimJ/RimL family protein N-acetyltransferase
MAVARLRTERLVLRDWRDDDLAPFATLNADPRVTEFLPGPLTAAESDALAARIRAALARHGFGLWAVQIAGGAPFIGFVGLSMPLFAATFTPCTEIGWRLASQHWGHGYASEAARAALGYGFERLGLDEIVAFTSAGNVRSRAVMERIGMTRSPADDFEHPSLSENDPLRPHVLYRARRGPITRPMRPSGRSPSGESPPR